MRSRKGIIVPAIIAVIALLAAGIWGAISLYNYFTDKDEEITTTTSTTTMIAKIIEYKSLNRSCTSNANCTGYYGNLGLDINTTCRNNICNQIIIK